MMLQRLQHLALYAFCLLALALICAPTCAESRRVIFLAAPTISRGQILDTRSMKNDCPKCHMKDHRGHCRRMISYNTEQRAGQGRAAQRSAVLVHVDISAQQLQITPSHKSNARRARRQAKRTKRAPSSHSKHKMQLQRLFLSAVCLITLLLLQCSQTTEARRLIFYNKHPSTYHSQLLVSQRFRPECPVGKMRDHRGRCRRAVIFVRNK
ncbi:uncharacterized protein LOC108607266 [Drosophila busckii]|uniref:uncharacterized protein LOC108607266 n=1 Tax=Drosophila busckii TaxID=30019 RepID=UPI001432A127|nr:uncharacterized protein LOC108607266 [Drosophila busckii]